MKKLISMFILALLAATVIPARADNVVVAAGAGYKAYVTELSKAYTAATGQKADLIFGNMAQVTTQAKAGGKAGLVIGAEWFFQKAGLDVSSAMVVGQGKPVLAWAKGKTYSGLDDLKAQGVRVAMPDPGRAIYGRAAKQYLESEGLYEPLKDSLLVVATIPQVGAYLMSGETDYGFINLTHAKKIGPKIGGSVVLEKGYKPIRIMVCRTSVPDSPAIASFLGFMKTDQAKAIAAKHGL